MNEKEYRAHPAISRSDLFKITESPEKFKYYMDNPPEATPSLIFGQLFHKMVLQPETLWDEFCVAPNVDRRTKAGKYEYEQFVASSVGKTVVTADMYEQALGMRNSVMRNKFAVQLLSGEKEVPYFWKDDLTGEECKCRVDCRVQIGDMPLIVDLKSAKNASVDSFIRESIKYGYDFQAGMYSEGVKVNTGQEHRFVFIVVEKEPPYAVNIFQADKLFVQRGYDLFRELIGIYHDCKTTGNWWGYMGKFNMVNNLCLPAYLAKEVE